MAASKSKSALRSRSAPPRKGRAFRKARIAGGTSKFFKFAVERQPKLLKDFIKIYGKAVRKRRFVELVLRVSPGPQASVVQVMEHAASPPAGDRARGGDTELQTELAAARQRGRARVGEIMRSDEMLNAVQFADLLHTTRMTVNSKRQKHEVLGLQGATRGFKYPRWQIDDTGRPFGVLPRLFKVLGGDSWSVYRFLVQHHPELDGLTGREALSQGKVDEVIEAAESGVRDFAS